MTYLRQSRRGRITRHSLVLKSVDGKRHEAGELPELAKDAWLHTGGGGPEAWSGPIDHCVYRNLIRCDCVVESHNVSANGRADILLAERGCLALQVEEPA